MFGFSGEARGMALIIFTDLDGTLLDSEDYDYRAAIPMLEKLKAQQVPVVPVTSKTRAEVEALRQELNLSAPFIVENGSGVFISREQHFAVANLEQQAGYYVKRLGCTYREARRGLDAIATALNQNLQGFGDLAEAEIEQLTGLTLDAVKRAKMREFSEPFITPQSVDLEQLERVAQQQGFRVLVGDRFSHLLGSGAGKGRATRWLIERYLNALAPAVTVGLGNSPNDLEMLETVDIPLVIPGPSGPHPELTKRGWYVATAPGAQGWAEAVAAVSDRLG